MQENIVKMTLSEYRDLKHVDLTKELINSLPDYQKAYIKALEEKEALELKGKRVFTVSPQLFNDKVDCLRYSIIADDITE